MAVAQWAPGLEQNSGTSWSSGPRPSSQMYSAICGEQGYERADVIYWYAVT